MNHHYQKMKVWTFTITQIIDIYNKHNVADCLDFAISAASSEEESDYEFEYEVLSSGSADLWGDTDERWVSAAGPSTSSDVAKLGAESSSNSDHQKDEQSVKMENISDKEVNGDAMAAAEPGETNSEELGESFKFEDLEHMMSEIGNIRDNLRLMPDFQRREMAANLAMKMAGMFGDGGSSDGE